MEATVRFGVGGFALAEYYHGLTRRPHRFLGCVFFVFLAESFLTAFQCPYSVKPVKPNQSESLSQKKSHRSQVVNDPKERLFASYYACCKNKVEMQKIYIIGGSRTQFLKKKWHQLPTPHASPAVVLVSNVQALQLVSITIIP